MVYGAAPELAHKVSSISNSSFTKICILHSGGSQILFAFWELSHWSQLDYSFVWGKQDLTLQETKWIC